MLWVGILNDEEFIAVSNNFNAVDFGAFFIGDRRITCIEPELLTC